MKNLSKRTGFENRHITALPNKITDITIVINDVSGEHLVRCKWHPFNKSKYSNECMPSDGYLGTARGVNLMFNGLGFHAWEQNNSEFIYYSIIN